MNRDLALNLMSQEEGKAYDPRLVNLLVENIDELESEVDEVKELVPQTVISRIESTLQPEKVEEKSIHQTVFHDIASTQREMQAVYEISQTIGKSLNVSETMSLLGGRIKRFVPYSACSIYLVNSEDDRVLPHHVAGMYKDILDGVETKLGEGVTGWVAANDKPLRNVAPAPDFPNLETLHSVFKSCLAVPLSLDRRVVGVITLYSDRSEVYQEDHLSLMEAIAPHSAAAINNAIIHEETREDSYTDPLTGLPNLRYFNAFIEEELKRGKSVGYPITMLMMDLEKFKAVNDRYGHKKGDLVLLEAGRLLRAQLRKSDVCLRYGGDEFLAILPGVDRDLAVQTTNRIRSVFDEKPITFIDSESVQVGISIGVAVFPEDGLEPDLLVAIADRDMYHNKMERAGVGDGRGSVISFEKHKDQG